jgi:hypothetical protein
VTRPAADTVRRDPDGAMSANTAPLGRARTGADVATSALEGER